MATLEQVIEGLIEFRDEVYSRLTVLDEKISALEMTRYNICTMCQGEGTIIPSHNLENPDPDPIACLRCSGAGKLAVGSSEQE